MASWRKFVFAVVSLMIAAAVFPAQAQEPIKVGLLLSHVGGTAIFARYEDKGARFAVEQVNKAGGINGRQIELVAYDTEGKPDRAGSLFKRLAQDDKVVAVIGPDSIYVVLGMSAIPAQMKVLSVAAPGNLELVAPDDRKYIVSAWGTSGYAASLVLAYFKDTLKVKRLGMITTADSIGEIVANEITGIAKMVGIEMAQVVSQPASDRDLLPSLRKLATLSPRIDGMMVFGSGPFGNIAVNQTEMAGLNVPIGYVGGNVIPELIKDVGPDTGKRTYLVTQRVTAAGSLPKDDPYYAGVQKFVTDYQARYNEPATLPTAVGYDMAMTVVDALKAVGPDPEKIRDYVYTKQKNMVGVQGVTFNRTPAYAYGTDPMDNTVVNIENGKFVFKSYLKDSFKRLGITEETVRNQMRDFKLILE